MGQSCGGGGDFYMWPTLWWSSIPMSRNDSKKERSLTTDGQRRTADSAPPNRPDGPPEAIVVPAKISEFEI